MRIYEVTDGQDKALWQGVLSELVDANEASFTDFTLERARRLVPWEFMRIANGEGEFIWTLTRVK